MDVIYNKLHGSKSEYNRVKTITGYHTFLLLKNHTAETKATLQLHCKLQMAVKRLVNFHNSIRKKSILNRNQDRK